MQEKKYRAFISYRHLSPDQEIAQSLHTAIETYGVPAAVRQSSGIRRMGRVFRDQEELPLSADLGADIEAALDGSEWLVCICSPRYLQSRWCMRELEYFLEHHSRDRVLTVLAEGEPADSFPEQLRFVAGPNGTRREVEPLAADVRGKSLAESLKKLRVEKLRLFAPMLSVSYDDLKQRARRRRLRFAAAAAAAVIVLGAAVGVYLAGDAAKKAELRGRAEEQQLLADAERKTAAANRIGELLRAADGARGDGELFTAAELLLEANALSEENGLLRRDELCAQLRRTMYTEPLAVLSNFDKQNIRLLNIVSSPDGRRMAGIANSNAVAMIDPAKREIVWQVSVNNEMISSLRFSPDGRRILAKCDMGRQVCVWSAADGALEFTYTSKADAQYQIANAEFWRGSGTLLIQDMEQLLLVSLDGTEKLLYTVGRQQDGYDPHDNLLTQSFGGPISDFLTIHTDDFTGAGLAVAPNWSRILVSGRDGSTGVIVLDPDGKRICLLEGLPAILGDSYAFSPDGRLVTCLSDGFNYFATFDAQTGKLQYAYGLEGSGHRALQYIPDSGLLTFVTNNNVLVMDGATAELRWSYALDDTMYVPDLYCAPDGKSLYVTAQDLYVLDARSGELIERRGASDAAPYNNVVFLRESLFLTQNDGSARLCALEGAASVRAADAFGGQLCRPYDPRTDAPAQLRGEHRLTEAFLSSTALTAGELEAKAYVSRDGKDFAIAYADGVLELFDAEGDGGVREMVSQLGREVTALGMVDGLLAAADANGRLLLYDMRAREVRKILNTDERYTDFAFSEDGGLLMARRVDWKTVDVYSLADGEKLFSLRAADYIRNYAFARDGSCAVANTASGAVIGELYTDEALLFQRARDLLALYD